MRSLEEDALLKGLAYYGGKSNPIGSWVLSLLPPPRRRQTYIETHAGMLGVLLRREPVGMELVNDLNERVVNWWRVVRDRGDELEQKMMMTPHSRRELEWAATSLDKGDELTRALAFTIVVSSSQQRSDRNAPSFAIRRRHDRAGIGPSEYAHLIEGLRERMIDIVLECRPAIEILRWAYDMPEAVIYIDPPYAGSDTSAYAVVRHDRAETLDILKGHQAKIAVSGFDDEWDDLGWHRSERPRKVSPMGTGDKALARVEVLWTNYQPDHQKGLI